MATIGTITVKFNADLGGLTEGIGQASSLLQGLTAEVEKVSASLAALSQQRVEITASVDTSAVAQAKGEIQDLKTTIESSSASVSVSADTSAVTAASTATEELAESVAEVEAPAVRSRGAIASLVVTASRVAATGAAVSAAYKELRESFVGYLTGITGAESATAAMSVVQSALRGDIDAMKVVLIAGRSAVLAYAKSFLDVGLGSAVLRGAIATIAPALGVNDQAVVTSIQHLVELGTRQYAAAATQAFYGKSLQTLRSAYNTAADGVIRFVQTNDTAAAVGRAVASAIDSITPTVSSLNAAFDKIDNAVKDVTKNKQLLVSVLQASAKAYDLVAAKIASVLPSFTGLNSSYKLLQGSIPGIVSSTSRLAPAIASVQASMAALLPIASRLFNVFSLFNSARGVISAATLKDQTAAGFAAVAAKMAATSVASGAVIGSLSAAAAGTSLLGGAATGAAGAVGTLVSTFPLFTALAATAAVATGRLSKELEKIAGQVESVSQLAERFGATTQEMERLKMAAEFSGTSMMALGRAQQSFFQNLAKIKVGQIDSANVREAKIAFDKLGVSLASLKSLEPREVFAQVGEKLIEVQDPAERTAIAMDLLGMRGAMIMPALKEFTELAKDFDRLGGALNDIDFKRFEAMEGSFDRMHAATKALGRTMLVPFVELQRAFNNLSAEISGGMSNALAPLASMIADLTKPVAAVIQAFGRMINVMLRIVSVLTSIAAWFQIFATLGQVFDGFAAGFQTAIEPLENLVTMLTKGSSKTSEFGKIVQKVQDAIFAIGAAMGAVAGAIANLVVAIGVGAAAWALYTAAVALASATSLIAAANFAIAWAAALGPIALVVGALAALGGGVMLIVSGITAGARQIYRFAESIGLIGKERETIDATKASVEELAIVAEASARIKGAPSGNFGEYIKSVQESRDSINELSIEAARFGEAGADVAAVATTEFNKLQTKLAAGEITLSQFREQSEKLSGNLRENLDTMKNDAPEATLKKNLEAYRQMDSAAKAAGKSIRDIAAGTVIDDKIFPASEEVKARAAEYKNEYVKALEEIKKKLQSGGFTAEIKEKRERNEADFKAGRITREQFEAVKLELDTTNAQEQAAIAAEEIKRDFDRQMKIEIEIDTSFADNIRKSLEDAFLSPVQKFDKELQKINKNKSLTESEKIMARADLRQKTVEGLVGKSAQAEFTDRRRDVTQAREAGLIGDGQFQSEMMKAAEDFAKAVGVTQTPFESFSSSMSNIAKQFGFAGQPLDQVREKLKGNAQQLALFDRAVKESRDNLLQSLGVEKSPEQVLQEQLKKIDEALQSGAITDDQAADATENAVRKRDEALGAGSNVAGQFAERQRRIDESFGGDAVKKGIAENKLAIDRRSAAGLDATPAQALKAGVDRVNDAFGVTGKSMAEIRQQLGPEGFAEYQEAIKKNSDAVKSNLGVEKVGAEKIAEARQKLSQAVADGVITEEEKNKALKQQRDGLLSSLGIKKSPAEDFEDAVQRIRENAAELSPEEIAKGLKEAKDSLLSSLGIDKSPTDQATESMKKLREAFNKGQISAEEFAKGSQKAKDTLLQSLGIPLDPVTQLRQRLNDLNEAFAKGEITQEEFGRGQEEAKRAMIPGGEEESPVQKFRRDLNAIERAASEGLISGDEASLRKSNLQSQLQEELKPSLDRVSQDRRGVEGADTRSKAGVDTFFRLLRGNDNPSLKAQLEIARNTKILAQAAQDPEAAPVIAQLAVR